jgi:hypothetical protein
MKVDKVEETLLLVKSFIDNKNINSFEEVAVQLYQLHHEMNDSYYEFCNRKIPNRWEDIPLLPISKFNENNKVGLNLNTEMPFPGIMFKSGHSMHFMRDTELYKNSIARSFPQIVLNEESWVPWINFLSVYPEKNNDSINYLLEYLSESFHGSVLKEIDELEGFIDSLIEEDGEEIKVTIPTVFAATQNILKDFLKKFNNSKDKYLEGIPLPLGSKVIEIENGFSKSSTEISKNICDVFGLTEILRFFSISEISSQIYANVKRSSLEHCLANGVKETTEYFSSPWLRFRTINPETHEDVGLGEIGYVAIYDLANFWSCPFILTEYRGKVGRSGGLILEESSMDRMKKVSF